MAIDSDRLRKSVNKLRKLIDRIQNESAPETVHDLRTNTRRFEVIFAALALDSHGIGKGILKDLARIRKRAGKVRDMDVLTGFASAVHLRKPEECQVELLEYLGARRGKQAAKLSAEAKKVRRSVRKTLKRARAVMADLTRQIRNSGAGNAVRLDVTTNAMRLAAQLGTPARLARNNLHPYRLKVKELHDMLRLASGPPHLRLIDDLAEVKDAIGEWHDWEELSSIGEKKLDHGSECRFQSELKRIATQKYQNALTVSGKFRTRYFRETETRGGRSSASMPKIPRPQVWEATSLLAG